MFNSSAIEKRIDDLLASVSRVNSDSMSRSLELFQGTLDLMVLLHGPHSVQVEHFTKSEEDIRRKYTYDTCHQHRLNLTNGALRSLKSAVAEGLLGSMQKSITGDVLSDFVRLARAALDRTDENAKNIASVLAAAVYEDTVRRLAESNGIVHSDKLQDVITALKSAGVVQGPQVGIMNSYLSFRNHALHAQWDRIERESVASVLGFVEQVLVRHLS